MPIDIAVDGMGSDKAPEPEIRGAILAAVSYDVRVHLVGPEDSSAPSSRMPSRGEHLPIDIVHASEWITMDDKAAQAVRSKRDSSMRVGLKMVREGRAAGFFTAGNTGAAMATAKMVLGMLPGVDRPALATVLPTITGTPSAPARRRRQRRLRPRQPRAVRRHGRHLRPQRPPHPQPARRPALDRRRRLQGQRPHPRHACRCFARSPASTSSATSKAATSSTATRMSIVCDGFVGNVALKTSEGIAKLVSVLAARDRLKSTVTSQVGALLSRKAFNDFKKRLDYSEYGGAPLLGVRGVCIVGHGSSNEKAIMNGIRVAAEFAQAEVNAGIEAAVARLLTPRRRLSDRSFTGEAVQSHRGGQAPADRITPYSQAQAIQKAHQQDRQHRQAHADIKPVPLAAQTPPRQTPPARPASQSAAAPRPGSWPRISRAQQPPKEPPGCGDSAGSPAKSR